VTDWALSDGGLDHVFVEIEPENVASLAAAAAAAAAHFRPDRRAPITTDLRGVPREFVVLIRDRDSTGHRPGGVPAR
jgi:RimJ/RimL family protein N-acetyltransferase